MASNHYWRYNTDPLDVRNNGSARCNGQAATFSSLWRYEAGKNRVEALLRDAAAARATPVDEAKLQTLLRTVSTIPRRAELQAAADRAGPSVYVS